MGSSALGAAALRKKLHKAGYNNIEVINFAIGNIPHDAQIVVSHEKLAQRAIEDSPQAEHIFVRDFTQNNVFDIIMDRLQNVETTEAAPKAQQASAAASGILKIENVRTGLPTVSKEEAIRAAGELLVKSGYVGEEYVEGMIRREADISTYVGKGIAIPHGENEVKSSIKKTGIVVLQYPQGVKFGDETAHLVVGIAGLGNDHLSILANIATTMDECTDAELQNLYTTTDAKVLFDMFTKAE